MSAKPRSNSRVSSATPARKVALELARTAREKGIYLSQASTFVRGIDELSAADRGFAHLLTHGAASVQVALDLLIDDALRSPQDIKLDVRDALRLSVFEIIYLHKEDHVAVDQGVELVRFVAPRATGVANHVLRRVVEAKQQFPYGDPSVSLEAAARFYGFHSWLADALEQDLGTSQTLQLMKTSVEPAPVWFFSIDPELSDEMLAATLQDAGIEYCTCKPLLEAGPPVFQLVERQGISAPLFLDLLAQNCVAISDLSAQSISQFASSLINSGDRMLEIGAGRGTKTLRILSDLVRRGVEPARYEVIDLSADKLAELAERASCAGFSVDASHAHDATTPFDPAWGIFDFVFIDVPCSGLGTLRRHPEIKARLNEDDPRTLAHIGQSILSQAASVVKPGGHLLYATCTVLDEENEDTIERFLASQAGSSFRIAPISQDDALYFHTPLETGADLHFAVLLERIPEEGSRALAT